MPLQIYHGEDTFAIRQELEKLSGGRPWYTCNQLSVCLSMAKGGLTEKESFIRLELTRKQLLKADNGQLASLQRAASMVVAIVPTWDGRNKASRFSEKTQKFTPFNKWETGKIKAFVKARANKWKLVLSDREAEHLGQASQGNKWQIEGYVKSLVFAGMSNISADQQELRQEIINHVAPLYLGDIREFAVHLAKGSYKAAESLVSLREAGISNNMVVTTLAAIYTEWFDVMTCSNLSNEAIVKVLGLNCKPGRIYYLRQESAHLSDQYLLNAVNILTQWKFQGIVTLNQLMLLHNNRA